MACKNKFRSPIPKHRRNEESQSHQSLPIIIENLSGVAASSDVWRTYWGIFTGHSVIVSNYEDAEALHTMGYFGQPATPHFGYKGLKVLRRRQFQMRQEWQSKVKRIEIDQTATHLVTDSDSSEGETVAVVKPKLKLVQTSNKQARSWYMGSWAGSSPDMEVVLSSDSEEPDKVPTKESELEVVEVVPRCMQSEVSSDGDNVLVISNVKAQVPPKAGQHVVNGHLQSNAHCISPLAGTLDLPIEIDSLSNPPNNVLGKSVILPQDGSSLKTSSDEVKLMQHKKSQPESPRKAAEKCLSHEEPNFTFGKNDKLSNESQEMPVDKAPGNGISGICRNKIIQVPENKSTEDVINKTSEVTATPINKISQVPESVASVNLVNAKLSCEGIHSLEVPETTGKEPEDEDFSLVLMSSDEEGEDVHRLSSPIQNASSVRCEEISVEDSTVVGLEYTEEAGPPEGYQGEDAHRCSLNKEMSLDDNTVIVLEHTEEAGPEDCNESPESSTDEVCVLAISDVRSITADDADLLMEQESCDFDMQQMATGNVSFFNGKEQESFEQVQEEHEKSCQIQTVDENVDNFEGVGNSQIESQELSENENFKDVTMCETLDFNGGVIISIGSPRVKLNNIVENVEILETNCDVSNGKNKVIEKLEGLGKLQNKKKNIGESVSSLEVFGNILSGSKEICGALENFDVCGFTQNDGKKNIVTEEVIRDLNNGTLNENTAALGYDVGSSKVVGETGGQIGSKAMDSLKYVQTSGLAEVDLHDCDMSSTSDESVEDSMEVPLFEGMDYEIPEGMEYDGSEESGISSDQDISQLCLEPSPRVNMELNPQISLQASPELNPEMYEGSHQQENPKDIREVESKGIIVISDSDVEGDKEQLFAKWKPELRTEPVYEECDKTLVLGLEETFFLMKALNCLVVIASVEQLHQLVPDQSSLYSRDEPGPSGLNVERPRKDCFGPSNLNKEEIVLTPDLAWQLFSTVQDTFPSRYVVYHYFRAKNYIVKSGLKFGGQFLLYHEGPSRNHASYVVLVLRSDDASANWQHLMTANRIAETTKKEVLVAWVQWPPGGDTLENLEKVCIWEQLVSRKKLNQSSAQDLSSEDSDLEFSE